MLITFLEHNYFTYFNQILSDKNKTSVLFYQYSFLSKNNILTFYMFLKYVLLNIELQNERDYFLKVFKFILKVNITNLHHFFFFILIMPSELNSNSLFLNFVLHHFKIFSQSSFFLNILKSSLFSKNLNDFPLYFQYLEPTKDFLFNQKNLKHCKPCIKKSKVQKKRTFLKKQANIFKNKIKIFNKEFRYCFYIRFLKGIKNHVYFKSN